mgnify:CR=1 FL=1
MGEFHSRGRDADAQATSSAGGANVSLRRYLGASVDERDVQKPRSGRPLTMDDIEQRARERFGWDLSGGNDAPDEGQGGAVREPMPEERSASIQPPAASAAAPVIDLKFVALAAWRYRTAVLAGAVVWLAPVHQPLKVAISAGLRASEGNGIRTTSSRNATSYSLT